jgi:hypothetical protein
VHIVHRGEFDAPPRRPAAAHRPGQAGKDRVGPRTP